MSTYSTVIGPIVGSLLAGSFAGVSSKVMYGIKATGTCGNHEFQKPFFTVLAMFIGEYLCIVALRFYQWFIKNRNEQTQSLLADGEEEPKKPALWVYCVLSCFDLSSTALNSVGLIWVDASSNQMLRGSMVVFTALFAYLMLGAKVNRKQITGILIVVFGLVLVGVCGFLRVKYGHDNDDGNAKVSPLLVFVGMLLILGGSAGNSIQNVLEQKLLQGTADVHPAEVVGYEGLFGTLLSSFILLPIVAHIPGSDCGVAEDTLDTLKMISDNGMVAFLIIGFCLSLSVMNFCLMEIAKVLTAVHRQLINACRTVLVWGTSIFLYYAVQPKYGEGWDNYSWIKMAGFFCLIYGTILYGKGGEEAKLEAQYEPTESIDVDIVNDSTTGYQPINANKSR